MYVMDPQNRQIYSQLQKSVLVRLMLYNARRPGEIEQLLVDDYKSRPAWGEVGLDQLKSQLSTLEMHLLHTHDLVFIRGKRGNKVPVIIPPDAKQPMDVLISGRTCVGITTGTYVFQSLGQAPFRADAALNMLVKQHVNVLEKPTLLKPTLLRKYTATISQLINLSDTEIGWVAQHLGHSLSVHYSHYRLHDSTIELTKVAKLLLLIESGQLRDYSGKSLHDLDEDDLKMEIEALDAGISIFSSSKLFIAFNHQLCLVLCFYD